ncbi:MAG: OmpA family protein [Bacteroidetes bacterium]|nr:OmpA family protein [Bacteroidota bacterium]
MKKILLFLFLSASYFVKSQDFTGFNQSNYAGVTGVYINPASIVDGRMKFDMTLVGINIGAYNNYIGIDRSAFKREKDANGKVTMRAFDDTLFADHYLTSRDNNRNKSIYVNNRIAGPSFMVAINRKNAIAFTSSVRNYVNIDGVSPNLAKLAYEEFKYPSLWVRDLSNKNLSIQEMSWAEYGLTYAHVFKEDNEHYLKGGATVKLLQGIQSSYMFIKDLQYNFQTDTTLSIFQSQVNYGHSDNLTLKDIQIGQAQTGTKVFDYSQSYPGVGFDFGVVYEWRPSYMKYKYDMDGEKDLWRKDKNKYKLKVGVSVTDIGSIKFKKGSTSGDFQANVGYWNLKPISPKSVGEFDDTLKGRFTQTGSKSTYRMNLPTAISVQIDYQIWKDVYVNLTPFIAFQFKKNDTKVHDISSITLTPRWDHKWFGVFIPVQYNFLDGFRAGAAVRLGPIIVGSTNLAPLVGQKKIYGADLYAMLKIPVPYGRPKDKDKDGISNKKDKCKDIPGVWEFMGCPDKDGDHIQDKDDKCPDVAGTKEMQGCPDRDGDGITDMEDNCPDDKGIAEFKGCPDRDGDKIMDKEDECPDDAGLAEFLGCPDRDGDKTPDKYDACPDVAGPKEFKGCPDKDGDTVLDKDDDCPEVAGAVENKGCPWPDTDKDGVVDREDECPTTPGLKELKGCPPAPVLKVEEQKILEKAFASLEFATGKDIIKKVSLPSLNDLAKLMKEHEAEWTLKLSGHTDNQGDAAKNMVLSEKRAKAVKKYLVSKGVKADKVIAEWFGQTVPIADNTTEAGRQKNRRVEMKVEFKK